MFVCFIFNLLFLLFFRENFEVIFLLNEKVILFCLFVNFEINTMPTEVNASHTRYTFFVFKRKLVIYLFGFKFMFVAAFIIFFCAQPGQSCFNYFFLA